MSNVITTWRKSSRSQGQGTCVEVGFAEGVVAVRDTKRRAAGQLTFAAESWQSFLRVLKRDSVRS